MAEDLDRRRRPAGRGRRRRAAVRGNHRSQLDQEPQSRRRVADRAISARPPKEAQETGTLNYVLLGSDSRDPGNEGNGRSDTIMVVHLNAKRNGPTSSPSRATCTSTFRATARTRSTRRSPSAARRLTVRTLENLTGVRMDHVVLVDFEGFIKLTEDLHGVTVTNKTAFTSHGFDYPKGKITITGEEALWFVRERHHCLAVTLIGRRTSAM